MIPILYDKAETTFTSEGLGRLSEITKIKVEEVRNGIYECEFEYPISGHLYDYIEDGIIFVDHDDTRVPQPFDVYRKTLPIDGVVTFYARHISYRLRKMTVMPFEAVNVSDALSKIDSNTVNGNPFTFWTDKTVTKNFSNFYPRSVRELLLGSSGSILDVFGTGEYEWDRFNVKLYLHRGTNTGVEIRYGKNMTKFVQDRNASEVYNAVAPFWKDPDNTVLVMLPEIYLVSSTKPTEDALQIIPLDLSDSFNFQPTVEQIRARATSYLNGTKTWKPAENIKVDFVALWETPEYKDYAPLERLRLCDSCNIIFTKAGVVAENVQIIRVVYDPLLERYTEMELGEPKKSFGSVIKASTEAAVIEQVPTKSAMTSAINAATLKIVGGTGGHVYMSLNADGEPEEIFIMDTDDVSTAVKVLRMNYQGIGFSSNGINGPYSTAWTIDGEFVADFITTGTLNAALVAVENLNASNITVGTLQGIRAILESGSVGGWDIESNWIKKDYNGYDPNGVARTIRVALVSPSTDTDWVLYSMYTISGTMYPMFVIKADGTAQFRVLDGLTVGTANAHKDSYLHGMLSIDDMAYLNGAAVVNGTLWLQWNKANTGRIYAPTDHEMYAYPGGDVNRAVKLSQTNGHWGFHPYADTYLDLGLSGNRWDNIYAQNGTIQTSDRRQKKSIKPLKDKIVDFVRGLNPVSFMMKSGKRTHYGFIAQDVEDLIQRQSIDFAGFVKQEQEDGKVFYGLRYEEFIAPIVKMVQYLDKRISALEEKYGIK